MMNRFLQFALAATVVVAFSQCGGTTNSKTDAGTTVKDAGSGTGGSSGTGGGTGGSAGTGGGTGTGGSAGTGGGTGTVTCTKIAAVPATGAWVGYNEEDTANGYGWWGAQGASPVRVIDGGAPDLVAAEYYYDVPGTAAFPHTATLDATYDLSTCLECAYYLTNCNPSTGKCGKFFLGHAGTMTFTGGTGNLDAGTFAGSAANLKLVEWNTSTDKAVVNGACVEITAEAFNTTWP